MAKVWIPVVGLKPIKLEEGRTYKFRKENGELTVLVEVEEPEWVDVTALCAVKIETSVRNGGLFAMLIYEGAIVAYFSPLHTIVKRPDNYKLELAKGAKISFRVFKRNSNA
jgi:hypothetical protein